MKKIISIILLAAAMFAAGYAQDIQRINGRDCVVYTVLPSEGLYAISKKFNVTQQEIMDINQQIMDGLKAGQKILIPVGTAKIETNKPEIKLEPEVKPEIKPAVEDTYFIHTVKRQDKTLFAISKLYDVDIEDIIKLNPEISGKLKNGMQLKIPHKKQVVVDDKTDLLDAIPDLFKDLPKTTNISSSQIVEIPYNIVFLLPFMLENTSPDASTKRFLEFYAGALMAVSEAKKQGITYNIHTFDTGKNENKIKEILTYPILKKADLIIGPVYSDQIPYITEFAKVNKINTLIPFLANIPGLDRNPYVFQFKPSIETEVNFAAQIFNTELKNANIIFVNLKNISASDNGEKFASSLLRQLKNMQREYTQMSVSDEELDYSKFDTRRKNVVIFNTDKYSTVQRYFDALDMLAQTREISVYAQYSWQMPEGKRFRYFNIAPFKQSYASYEIRNHQLAFERNFGWKPVSDKPAYNLLGYDLTRFFLNGTKDYIQFQNSSQMDGLQSFLNFERNNAQSGFMNKKLYFNEK